MNKYPEFIGADGNFVGTADDMRARGISLASSPLASYVAHELEQLLGEPRKSRGEAGWRSSDPCWSEVAGPRGRIFSGCDYDSHLELTLDTGEVLHGVVAPEGADVRVQTWVGGQYHRKRAATPAEMAPLEAAVTRARKRLAGAANWRLSFHGFSVPGYAGTLYATDEAAARRVFDRLKAAGAYAQFYGPSSYGVPYAEWLEGCAQPGASAY